VVADVADAVEQNWGAEEIPDDAILYLRVRYTLVDADGYAQVNAFRDQGEAMSMNWSKYATPEDTRQFSQRHPPHTYAVYAITAEVLRAKLGLIVVHTPRSYNRAHVDVIGEKTAEVRTELSELCQCVLREQL
jgi:hypothetical protein